MPSIAAVHTLVAAPPSTRSTPITPDNPLGTTFTNYIQTRRGTISVAVYNATNNTLSTYQPGIEFDTASIIKVSIMSTLLWESQNTLRTLTSAELSLITPMIECSSNSDATALWQDAGRSAGIGTFLHAVGMTATSPGQNGFWGLTQTTATDQVTLLKALAYPHAILTPASQAYVVTLMEHVTPWEAWGVSGGIPAGKSCGAKKWLAADSWGGGKLTA